MEQVPLFDNQIFTRVATVKKKNKKQQKSSLRSVHVLKFSSTLIPAALFSVYSSSFPFSALGRRGDLFGVFLETTGPGMVSAKRNSWRKCSRAMRRVSEVTSRLPSICAATLCKPTRRTASYTVTAPRLFSNWASSRPPWTMLKKPVS